MRSITCEWPPLAAAERQTQVLAKAQRRVEPIELLRSNFACVPVAAWRLCEKLCLGHLSRTTKGRVQPRTQFSQSTQGSKRLLSVAGDGAALPVGELRASGGCAPGAELASWAVSRGAALVRIGVAAEAVGRVVRVHSAWSLAVEAGRAVGRAALGAAIVEASVLRERSDRASTTRAFAAIRVRIALVVGAVVVGAARVAHTSTLSAFGALLVARASGHTSGERFPWPLLQTRGRGSIGKPHVGIDRVR